MHVIDQIITTKLSLAISLKDDFTQKENFIGNVKVTIPGLNLSAEENPGGYHNFLDIAAGTYTIRIGSDFYIDKEIKNINLPRRVDYYFPAGGGAIPGSSEAVLTDISGLLDGDIVEFDNSADPPERRMITVDPNPAMKRIKWDVDPQVGLLYDYPDSASIRIPSPENFIIRVGLKPCPLYPFPSGTTLLRGTVKNTQGKPVAQADVELVGSTLNSKTTEDGDFVLYFPAAQGDASTQIRITPEGDPPKTIYGEIKKGGTTSLSIAYP